MQLKYLNFHKLISNFAGNLVGGFISLMVYNYTNSFLFAFLYLVYETVSRIVVTLLLRKQFFSKPQIMLLLRIVTMLVYNAFIIVMDFNFALSIAFIGFFLGADYALKGIPNEAIYNYSSLNKDSGSLGITRMMEKVGYVAAALIGGFLLDINKIIVVAIAIGLYSISVIPLLIFYFKSKKSKVFNKDAISNAIESLYSDDSIKEQSKKLTKEILIRYAVLYFLYSFIDVTTIVFKFYVFSTGGKYSAVGIYTAFLQGAYGLSGYLFGYLDSKKDTTALVSLSCVLLAVFNLLLVVFDIPFVLGLIYSLIGFFLPMQSVYLMQRYLTKSRILGISNRALLVKDISVQGGYVFLFLVGTAFSALLPVFITISLGTLTTAALIPQNEEKTRKILVDILENNEICASKNRKKKKVKKTADDDKIEKSAKTKNIKGKNKKEDA